MLGQIVLDVNIRGHRKRMQQLTLVRTQYGKTLYCDMCKTEFMTEFVIKHTDSFLEAHRHIHKRTRLDTPDIPDTEDKTNTIEISRDIEYRTEQLSTGLPTTIPLISPSKVKIYPQK